MHADQREVMSMHSVISNKPAPLTPRKPRASLDLRAYNAAIEHMLAVKDSSAAVPSPGSSYSRQASARRMSMDRNDALKAAPQSQKSTPSSGVSASYRHKHGKLTAPAGRRPALRV